MKRHLFLLFLFLLSAVGFAQTGLSVSPFFADDFVRNSTQTSISLQGQKVKPYKLSLFRSITLSAQGEHARAIERAVLADAARAVEHEAGMKKAASTTDSTAYPPKKVATATSSTATTLCEKAMNRPSSSSIWKARPPSPNSNATLENNRKPQLQYAL